MRKGLMVRVGAVAVAAAMLFGNGAAMAMSSNQRSASKAVDYMKAQVHDDGGFGTTESTLISTSIAIISLKSAGADIPASKTKKTAIDYLRTAAPALKDADPEVVVRNTAKIAHLIIALKAAGQNPRDFAGTDWVALMKKSGEKATGWYGTTEIDHMWALLALATVDEAIPATSVIWLKNNQEDNGGFAVDKKIDGMGSDTNSTALAIQALIGVGETKTSPVVKKAIVYLKTQQNKDGGFPYVTPSPYGTDSDSSSTAWVLQALVAAGERIDSKTWVKTAVTPMGFLMSLQNADGGFMYQKTVPDSNILSTSQAMPALMLKPLPYKAIAPAKEEPATATSSTNWVYLAIIVIAVLVVAVLGLFVVKKKA